MQVGRHARTRGSRVVGVVSCVPSEVTGNDHFRALFGDKAGEIEKMTGVRERRWVQEGQTTADLCQVAARRLLDRLGWEADSVDALIFVTQTPDFRLPATACALQERLGLAAGMIAFDVNLGCSGYPYGLWLASTMIQAGGARRVLLLVGDTISRTVDPDDRSTAMLFGDAGTATAVEASEEGVADFILGTDGKGERNLIIAEGAYRRPDPATGEADARKADALFMNGGEIFNFTLKAVPALVSATLEAADAPAEAYDAFLFHQANAFMVRHLIKKAKIPADRAPINIDRYGNTSSATIPLLLTTDLASRLGSEQLHLAMFGFGVGYSWASAALEMGPLDCVETVEA